MTQVVAVDIGGTHARFALAEVAGGRVQALGEPVTLKTAEHASFQTAWEAFAAGQPAPLPRAAAIAIACPIKGEVLQLTNNPWIIRPSLIPEKLGVDAHVLVNDFEAVGHAVAQVGADDLHHICGPDVALPDRGIVSIVGPGTGLGVGQLFRDGAAYHVIACEGGHVDFAPLDAIEDAVLADLRKTFRRVSVERVVSGPGLAAIHAVLARLEGRAIPERDDKQLWQAALDGSESLAAAALDRFCLTLGAVAGDCALINGPTAVVIAGGVGLRLKDHLPRSGFAERFAAKGRFETLMRSVPVKLITHPQPGLLGAAAAFAREHTS
ncbi:glucokinase [Sphingomonas sp. SUN039]|uniref:glucokinase n=1 Tax=Sphingomonas sp. SUN039 TaxID=2937787 RepID=UPI0021643D7A|nr:glucokinase [Sphingomonas sp. SUN039]UVO53942.1 glucokinase [Sphingomonas sp. SUN039]